MRPHPRVEDAFGPAEEHRTPRGAEKWPPVTVPGHFCFARPSQKLVLSRPALDCALLVQMPLPRLLPRMHAARAGRVWQQEAGVQVGGMRLRDAAARCSLRSERWPPACSMQQQLQPQMRAFKFTKRQRKQEQQQMRCRSTWPDLALSSGSAWARASSGRRRLPRRGGVAQKRASTLEPRRSQTLLCLACLLGSLSLPSALMRCNTFHWALSTVARYAECHRVQPCGCLVQMQVQPCVNALLRDASSRHRQTSGRN
jgi:hypothetical protein